MADPAPSVPLARRTRRLSIGAVVVLGLVVLSVTVGLGLLRGQAAPQEVVPLTDASGAPGPSAQTYVHVLGAVERPGLYVLGRDARIVDALAAAGGTTDAADLGAVNLARIVEDGEQIVVSAVGDAGAAAGSAEAGDERIDLNTADQAALESLPRIGPALAQRIIAWRDDNGRFRSVDDLLAVPGIGDKLLAGLSDLVRV